MKLEANIALPASFFIRFSFHFCSHPLCARVVAAIRQPWLQGLSQPCDFILLDAVSNSRDVSDDSLLHLLSHLVRMEQCCGKGHNLRHFGIHELSRSTAHAVYHFRGNSGVNRNYHSCTYLLLAPS